MALRERVRRRHLDPKSESLFGILDVQVKRKWLGRGMDTCSYGLWTEEKAHIIDSRHSATESWLTGAKKAEKGRKYIHAN